MSLDFDAVWVLPMNGRHVTVEFSHGITTGKQVVRANGNVIVFNDSTFNRGTPDDFEILGISCSIFVKTLEDSKLEFELKVLDTKMDHFRKELPELNTPRAIIIHHQKEEPANGSESLDTEANMHMRQCLEQGPDEERQPQSSRQPYSSRL